LHKNLLFDYICKILLKTFLGMHIGLNIKKIREKKGFMQKEIAAIAGMHPANYNKVEKGEREPSIEAIAKIAKVFGLTVDQLIYDEGKIINEVTVEDKTATEQIRLIAQLNDKDKSTVMHIIDTMLTKQKFQTFFEQNLQIAK
jgi:transcriptional regulator with XRE-family HTH domain